MAAVPCITSLVPTIAEEVERLAWIEQFNTSAEGGLFDDIVREEAGRYSPAVRYDANSRILAANEQHPYVAHLIEKGRGDTVWKLFAAAELLTDVLASEVDPTGSADFLGARDRVLRALVKDERPVAADILGLLDAANSNDTAFERAVGRAFEVLGFRYRRLGGRRGGPDGVLEARLGILPQGANNRNFSVVFDAKTSAGSVPNDKARFDAIHRFMEDEKADYGFVIAARFDGGLGAESNLNREARAERVTVMTVDQLKRIVLLHARLGLTLTDIEQMWAGPYVGADEERRHGGEPPGHYSLDEVESWLDHVEQRLSAPESRVPVRRVLDGLEELKSDDKDHPSVSILRYTAG